MMGKERTVIFQLVGAERRSGAGWGLDQLRAHLMMAKGQLNGSTLYSDVVDLSPVVGAMGGPR